ncbi:MULTISPECIES: hypothetical protein [Idiomarina]|jgi:hypothetical protein|uniref:hypothetical protein n=1 Tax=Idiomarina TaxID=135575 RepID=UPI000C09AB7F|nr:MULTISPECIES: hypothetical protein [Idiomarina]MAC35591.1 hypothetical protein [Haliea sp.]MAO67901.1 hypothetical protein [Idiomarina sp.]MBF79643.1 hypothetical protein [Idiomarina sp.]|tara:strand:+ start:2264 stop:2866 length:603 start_codon:yes stop_codon:yes gene_type:complete
MTVSKYEKYKKWSSQYDGMAEELKEMGLNHLKTFFFLSYFTLGFAYFSSAIFSVHDSDKIIRVLFDEGLFFFSVGTFIIFYLFFWAVTYLTKKLIFLSPLKVFFRWASYCTYEFIFSLLTVYLIGFTIGAKVSIESVPWLDLTQASTYVLFTLTVIFFVITFGLFLFVEKNKPKKKQALKLLSGVTFFWGVLTVISNIIS